MFYIKGMGKTLYTQYQQFATFKCTMYGKMDDECGNSLCCVKVQGVPHVRLEPLTQFNVIP